MERHRQAVLFVDICASTRYFVTHGEVAGRRMVERCLRLIMPEIERHRGRIVKTLGDGVLAAFGSGDELVEAAWAVHAAVDSDNRKRPDVPPVRIHSGGDMGPAVADRAGDLFGDVVNVAARIQGLAGPDQIYLTARVVEELPPAMRERTRAIGSFPLRGMHGEVEVHEAIWRFEGSTFVVPRRLLHVAAHLTLDYAGHIFEMSPDQVRLSIGRIASNDLIVDDGSVSREHAEIVWRKGFVMLVDHSTNGTYLRPAAGEPRHLHRGEALLEGGGTFTLGRDDGPAIEYTVTLQDH